MTVYRAPTPYRSRRTYRGLELTPAVPPPGRSSLLAARWVLPAAQAKALAVRFAEQAAQARDVAARWDAPEPQLRAAAARWNAPQAIGVDVAAPWRDTRTRLADAVAARWSAPAAREVAGLLPWSTLEAAGASVSARWAAPEGVDLGLSAPWSTAEPRDRALSALWKAAAARGAWVALPWGPAGQRQIGTDIRYPVDPDPDQPGGTPLQPPVREVYIMIPSISAVVLPSRTPIQLGGIRLTADDERYCWDLSASIPARQQALVDPSGATQPVEIELAINGYTWVLAVESVRSQARFGLSTCGLVARSRSVLLDAPYAPLRTGIAEDAATAAQLAEAQLSGSGWTLVWDAVDWLVPGGTWSWQDASAIDALAQIAASIGARVETDRSLLQLRVKPRYAVSPWSWAAASPYAILPASVLFERSGDWQGGANPNRVYVVDGAGQGSPVVIIGTGGESVAPLVVERLLVDVDAQRERGRQELARAGRIRTHGVTLPLFPAPADPGLIPVGALLQVSDPDAPGGSWKGQVRSVTITADSSADATSVRQQITLERQYR